MIDRRNLLALSGASAAAALLPAWARSAAAAPAAQVLSGEDLSARS